jgi:preprotein translocase subunit SecG
VTPLVLLAQILISIALMASVLLQSRGAGLGATFGGDSSVYRSRRGIEKRLFQFTVLLGIVFCLCCFLSFLLVGTNA